MKWLIPAGIVLAIGAGLASTWRPLPKVGDTVVVPLAKLRGPEGEAVTLPQGEGITGSELVVRITEVTGSQIRGNPVGFVREGNVQVLPPIAFPIQLLTFNSADITGRAGSVTSGGIRR